jgi:aldehyde dehydrogenase (NAD+)
LAWCGLITPWNWPMNQIALKVVAGQWPPDAPCILKPSEESRRSMRILFAEMIA